MQKHVISYNNFDQDKIVLNFNNKKCFYEHETYNWKKFVPKYNYGQCNSAKTSICDDIYIQLPELFSFGIKTFEGKKDPKTGITSAPAHSFSFSLNVEPTEENEYDEATANDISEKTVKMFDSMLDSIKSFLKDNETVKRVGKFDDQDMWHVLVKKLKFYDYQKDKDTKQVIEGALPTLFAKLKVDSKSGAIKTLFQELDKEKGTINNILPTELPQKFENVRCMAIGVVHLESIFVGGNNTLAIQLKLHQVLITKILKSSQERLIVPEYLMKKKEIEKVFDENDQTDDDEEEERDAKPHTLRGGPEGSTSTAPVAAAPVKRIIRRKQ